MLASGVDAVVILYCRDETGEHLEVPAGAVGTGFRERKNYFFTASLPGGRLFIDEAPLATTDQEGQTGWVWQPGFYAGQVVAELMDASGKLIAEFRLDVSPDESKLGADLYEQLVNDLLVFDPKLLFGVEHAQTRIGTEGEYSSPHLSYARLRKYGPALVRSLLAVAMRPLTRLDHERALKPLQEVRRLDRLSMAKARQNPKALSLLLGAGGDGGRHEQVLFDVNHSRESFDNPANRALGVTLDAVIRRTKKVAKDLSELDDGKFISETRSQISPRLPRRLRYLSELSVSLKKIQQSLPFSILSRKEVSAAGLNAIAAQPVYANAFRYGWRALRSGTHGDGGDEFLWISPTWEIYERWCFLKVTQALGVAFPSAQWTFSFPTSRDDCIKCQGVDGDEVITAWLQARFPSGDAKPFNGFRSISGERYPDITVTRKCGQVQRLAIFDAKYRVSRQGVLESMASAHLYKDSLRWHSNEPCVAMLLVPRAGGAGWLEADDFIAANGVGVLQLGGDSDLPRLVTVLRDLL